MKTVYLVWATIPFALFFVAIRAFLKCRVMKGLREDYKFTFLQGIYATVFWFVAIACDVYIFEYAISNWEIADKVANITRFLLYPVVLLIAALVQGFFFKKKDEATVKRRFY